MDLKDKLGKVKPTASVGGIEKKPRLSQAVQDVLNEQIKNELYSSQLYKAMASCLDDRGWNYASKLFYKYGQEELTHADKVYEYMYDRNCKPITPSLEQPPQEFAGIRDILSKSLEHEIGVTANWENIAKIALDNDDKGTLFFSKWFIDEQVNDEEPKFRDLLDLMDLGTPDWMMELNFKEMLG